MDPACKQNIMLVDSGSVMIYNDLVSSHLHPFMLSMFPGYEELLQQDNSPSPSCVGDKKLVPGTLD